MKIISILHEIILISSTVMQPVKHKTWPLLSWRGSHGRWQLCFTFVGSVLHQQDVDRFVQRLQLPGRFWGWRVVIKMVPAPVSPSSSFSSLVLVLQAVAVPGATSSAVVPLTVSAGVQGSSPATIPPGSVRAGRGPLLAPSAAPPSLVVVPPSPVLRFQVSFAVRGVVPAFVTVPAVVIGIVIMGGGGVFPTVSAWGRGLLQRLDRHLTRSLNRLTRKEKTTLKPFRWVIPSFFL